MARRRANVGWRDWYGSFTRAELFLSIVLGLLIVLIISVEIAWIARGGEHKHVSAVSSGPVAALVNNLTRCTPGATVRGRPLVHGEYPFVRFVVPAGSNMTKALCAVSIVSPARALTTASCADRLKEGEQYWIIGGSFEREIDTILVHRTGGIAMIKTTTNVALERKQMLRFVAGPASIVAHGKGDAMMMLVMRKDNYDQQRLYKKPVFVPAINVTTAQGLVGTPLMKGEVLYAMVGEKNDSLVYIGHYADWIKGTIRGYLDQ